VQVTLGCALAFTCVDASAQPADALEPIVVIGITPSGV
jgi:hypothetical protein